MASTTMMVLALCFSSSPCAGQLVLGMFSAPTMWPAAKSLPDGCPPPRPASLLTRPVSSPVLRLGRRLHLVSDQQRQQDDEDRRACSG
jgi:hypothetical protein